MSSSSEASFACWKARSGLCTQIAERSTTCVTPAARAAASAWEWAAWSMAQASRGTPVREARQETSASNRSPQKPSRVSDCGSVTSP